jgi:NADH-quinone oxidoreductase subunit L
VILAVFSVIGGWPAAPALWGGEDHFEHYLAPVFAASGSAALPYAPAMNAHTVEQQLTLVAFLLAALGFLVAWWLCVRSPAVREKLAQLLPAPYRLLQHKYYVDEFYQAVIVRPLLWISTNVLWRGIDLGLIDGSVNRLARSTAQSGDAARRAESGNERSYASWMVVGGVAVTALLLWLVVR